MLKIMRGFFITLCLLMFGVSFSTAQKSKSSRIEFESKDELYGFTSVSYQDKGVVILYKRRMEGKVFSWHIYKYDTTLTRIDSAKIETDKNLYLSRITDDGENIYVFERNYKKGGFKMHTISMKDLSTHSVRGNLMKKAELLGYAVQDGVAYLPVYHRKTRNTIVQVDINSGIQNQVLIEVEAKRDLDYQGIEILDQVEGKEVWVKYKNCKGKDCDNYVVPLSVNVENLSHVTIEKQGKYEIIDFASTKQQDGSVMISGTYSNNVRPGETSEGMFLGKIEDGELRYAHYTSFLEMKNFFNYLSDRKKEKIQLKQKRKEQKGKELNLNYRIAVHDIQNLGEDFLIIGEAYYPTYRTESYQDRGRTFWRTVFDGYQYSHAVIAAYNKEGELLWDQSFKMWLDEKPFYVKRFLSVSTDEDKIALLYLNGGKLKTATIQDGKIEVDESEENFDTGFEGDKIKSVAIEETIHWYNNHFLSWGFQRIRNKENKKVKKNRRVYYLNKVTFDNE